MHAPTELKHRRLWLLATQETRADFEDRIPFQRLQLELNWVELKSFLLQPDVPDVEPHDVVAVDCSDPVVFPLCKRIVATVRALNGVSLAVYKSQQEQHLSESFDGSLHLDSNACLELLSSHLQWHARSVRAERATDVLWQVTQLAQRLACDTDIHDLLSDATQTLAKITDCERASIVLANLAGDRAYVVSTSDDADISELPIHIADYPELAACLTQTEPVIVDDTLDSKLMARLAPDHKLPFRSEALIPLRQNDRTQGALFLRALPPRAFADADLPLLQLVARSIELAVANARFIEHLRLQTEQSALAKQQAVRRLNLFKPYVEFFKTSAEGMVVTDRSGQILYTNPAARHFSAALHPLEGKRVLDFLADSELPKARALATQVIAEGVTPAADFIVNTNSGPRCLSVNARLALKAGHSILLTFRDVTRERNTEKELLHTKDFLERVIDSSVDAIVSADLSGNILVFNRAAARIFGYDPTDVVGRMNVKALYPAGGARTVMRHILDLGHGGAGRLEDYQTQMVDRLGRMLPVKLSAAVVLEGDVPVATVGVFTDIRKELQMQARLQQAQQELRETEKGAALAQLAGMTAHELNQPLTCVIAYSELLQRRCDDSATTHAAGVIVDQAHRMAQIVRRLGHITRYETKSYVGTTAILDLDRSTDEKPDDL